MAKIRKPKVINPVGCLKTYKIERRANVEAHVIIDGKEHKLNPRLDLFGHSPNGFEYGYEGSGPAQLALAILADATGDDQLSVEWHQDFKRDIVARQEGPLWEITNTDVLFWLSKHGESIG